MRARSSGPLFLAELVVMILVFSLCAAALLGVFAAAREKAAYSERLSSAVVWADSAASAYKSAQGDLKTAAARLSDAATTEAGGYTLRLDESWKPVTKGESYLLRLEEDGQGAARVSVSWAGGEIFAIEVRAA